MFNTEQLLGKIYYSPKFGYQGADKLYKKAQEFDPEITKKEVSEFLKEQEIYQLNEY